MCSICKGEIMEVIVLPICLKCKREIQKEALFCPYCGEKTDIQTIDDLVERWYPNG